MSFVVALVGRPNVGKSTLFNRLTGTRDALVADVPGVTRDRKYGYARHAERQFIVVDTGGLGAEDSPLQSASGQQAREAVREADLVLLLVDARAGLVAGDELIASELRREGKRVLAVVNKIDGSDERSVSGEFYALGIGVPVPVAALHGRGVRQLLARIVEHMAPGDGAAPPEGGTRVAVIGRPNAGKSTLVNRLLGEPRMIAAAEPGTTRDSVEVAFTRGGRRYTLIDTAGVRRRARVADMVEKFSVLQTLAAIEQSHVVVLLIDALEGIADQDLTLLGHVIDSGRALVIAVNKWDALGAQARERALGEIDRRLGFVGYARVCRISALHGSGIRVLLEAVRRAHESATRQFATPDLTRLLEDAVAGHPPPLINGRRIKLRYAHQGGANPPQIVVHGNQTDRVPQSYRRYLANYFARAMRLQGTPLRLLFRSAENPFAGRPNPLSRRQQLKRRRMLRHHKR